MSYTEFIPTVKIILLGDMSVGKTALLQRFIRGSGDIDLHTIRSTTGPTPTNKLVNIRGRKLNLNIWDTAGMERFQSLTRSHYRGVLGAILVYDAADPGSVVPMERWHEELLEFTNRLTVSVVVVANKVDQVDGAIPPVGQEFARRIGALYKETSALTGQGVSEMFNELCLEVMRNASNILEQQRANHQAEVALHEDEEPGAGAGAGGGGCC
ncbi:hypothetical protein M407DRAFT_31202 [Tulasnella calospora MUT 4182]|uniref:Uncharacterized protein n=1 Tax=Tulasnella calospora MUT 4182 TaxID=1051891 RepID=A0A0C3PVZ0_9AGAM|nr:hypothetical protein M407DRAFT_31202 [Tulasnella calospora MUT 4182]